MTNEFVITQKLYEKIKGLLKDNGFESEQLPSYNYKVIAPDKWKVHNIKNYMNMKETVLTKDGEPQILVCHYSNEWWLHMIDFCIENSGKIKDKVKQGNYKKRIHETIDEWKENKKKCLLGYNIAMALEFNYDPLNDITETFFKK